MPNIEALLPNDSEAEAGSFAENIVLASKIKMDKDVQPTTVKTVALSLTSGVRNKAHNFRSLQSEKSVSIVLPKI